MTGNKTCVAIGHLQVAAAQPNADVLAGDVECSVAAHVKTLDIDCSSFAIVLIDRECCTILEDDFQIMLKTSDGAQVPVSIYSNSGGTVKFHTLYRSNLLFSDVALKAGICPDRTNHHEQQGQ